MVVEALIRKPSLKSLVTPEMKNYLIVPWDTKRNEIDLMDCVEYYRKNIYIYTHVYMYIYIYIHTHEIMYIYIITRLYIYIWNNIYTKMYFTSKLSECWWFLFPPNRVGKRFFFSFGALGAFWNDKGPTIRIFFSGPFPCEKSHNKKDVTVTVYEENVSFFKFFPSHQVINKIWKPKLPGQTHPSSDSIGTFLSCVALGGNDAGATGEGCNGVNGVVSHLRMVVMPWNGQFKPD